ncbi:hypothetical protein FA15DRAFT_519359 [Coprinopsis marcescibilis]|uniref:Mitochondrial import inner membrane translocase subunit n=1 Tax=Coprinopsis marcescibilis TaxID=230819 RepID=A0A5C3KPU8_COPMA|nr:hypothetical protein FA15DRAFT_519359 [Coprinopsis marcescibilis]
MADLSGTFDAATQKELGEFVQTELAKRRVQASIQRFTSLCWDNQLSRSEESCIANCVDRFMDASLFIVSQVEEKQRRNQMS